MEKLTLNELEQLPSWSEAVIVFTKDSFDKEYTELERSYKISRENKYFSSLLNGSSLYGDCLDGKDDDVRLDIYMNAKEGKPWNVDFCYVLK